MLLGILPHQADGAEAGGRNESILYYRNFSVLAPRSMTPNSGGKKTDDENSFCEPKAPHVETGWDILVVAYATRRAPSLKSEKESISTCDLGHSMQAKCSPPCAHLRQMADLTASPRHHASHLRLDSHGRAHLGRVSRPVVMSASCCWERKT